MHHHARRLIDHQQHLILVYDIESDGLSQHLVLRCVVLVHRNRLARHHPIGGLDGVLVDQDQPLAQGPLDKAAGGILQPIGQELVYALRLLSRIYRQRLKQGGGRAYP